MLSKQSIVGWKPKVDNSWQNCLNSWSNKSHHCIVVNIWRLLREYYWAPDDHWHWVITWRPICLCDYLVKTIGYEFCGPWWSFGLPLWWLICIGATCVRSPTVDHHHHHYHHYECEHPEHHREGNPGASLPPPHWRPEEAAHPSFTALD